MPFYEYECSCGDHPVVSAKMGEAPKNVKCDCGKSAYRLFGNAGFILTGPGDQWPSQQLRRKNQMTKKNIAAGERGRGKWAERMPKLVYK